MKEVTMLDNYELLHAIESHRLGINDTYQLYDLDYIWEELNKRYKSLKGDREKIYQQLYQEESYKLLNDLTSNMVNKFLHKEDEIDNIDLYFYDNLDLMNERMHDEYLYEYNKNLNARKLSLPKIEKHEVTGVIKDILDKIDNNGEWKNIYEEALNQGKIVYVNELTEEEIAKLKKASGIIGIENGGTLYNQTTGELICMFLRYEGDINDVYLTMHEVVHYINRYLDKNKIKPTLKEFPSIFYEFYSLDCLESYGCDKNSLDDVRSTRSNYIVNAYQEIQDIMYYLTLYKKDGYISSENDLEDNTGKYNRRTRTIEKLLREPDILFSVYPYIIGTYLANQAIIAIKDDKTIEKIIKYTTEHLSKIAEDDIFNILEYSTKNKEFIKRRER